MPPVRVIVASPEEAFDGNAEFWCGGEMMAITVLYDGRLHLRIDPRRDGEPWMIETPASRSHSRARRRRSPPTDPTRRS